MQPGALVAERFEIERVAGTGGMGTVYRAHDRASGGAVVAVKVVSGQQSASRFEREARVLAEVRHPGIVRYIDHGRTVDGELYLAMEWLEGEDLGKRLGRTGLTALESVELAVRVGEALGAAHARGIVHRDVKPSNLFLPDGDLARVKVLDFGIARVGGTRAQTRTGMLLGTPGYMAPEQARGGKDVDARADVFALGCVLFECLTGRAAFVGEHVMALLAKILLEEAPRVAELRPDVPADLDKLVARLLAKDPQQRPRDGAQVAAELRALGAVVERTPPPVKTAGPALTATEQRLLCVVLASDVGPAAAAGAPTVATVPTLMTPKLAAPEPTLPEPFAATVDTGSLQASAPTLDGGAATVVLERLQAAVLPFGARLERLMDGSAVVTLAAGGLATDQAAQAARCALAMRAVVPSAPMALAIGRGVIAGRWPVGEAIDRAARLLRASAPVEKPSAPPVRIDDVTAGLLDVRFDLGGDRAGLYLRGERDVVEGGRTLLGKPTPCVGRDRELGVLAGLLDECLSEPMARAVLVTGPAGVGKSRVRYEFLRKVKARGAALLSREAGGVPPIGGDVIETWIGRGDPLRAGSPFGMIAPALRRAAAILDGESLDVRQRKLRARVARHVPARDVPRVTEFLGELIGAPFPDEGSVELRAARADAQLLGDQMRRAFEDLLRGELSAGPLLIVLEDLHWGDLPSVKFIDHALRALADRPLLVLALARPEVRELFPGLWLDRPVEELRLGELSRRGSEKLVRGVLGDAVNDALVTQIVERAGGNAFYLEELIRAVAEGKQDAMPETLLAVVQARLERLEGDARRVLRAASVFGQLFWRGGVRALLGGEDRTDVVDAWLAELEEREVVVRRGVGKFKNEEDYGFRHALVREAAYAMLTDSDRRLGHKLAGEWLERAGESEAVVLAEHFERGGERARAVGWYRRAAEQALGGNDLATAIRRAEHGIACGADGEVLGALRLIQAEANQWRGDFAEAERCGLEAMASLPRGSSLWFGAAGEVATASGKLARTPRLVEVGEALLAAPAAGASGPQVTASAHTAFQLYYAGQYALASRLLERVEKAEAEVRERDPAILARIHQARSSRALFAGDAGVYLAEEQAAALSFERAGDLRNWCMQRGHVAYASLEIGDFAGAERALRDTIEAGERMGLRNVVATAKHNLGMVLGNLGRVEDGVAVEREALALFLKQGDRRLEAGARAYLARLLILCGDLAAAEREAEASIAVATPSLEPGSRATLAMVLLHTGRVAEALVEATAAMRKLEELGGVEEGEALIRLAWAEALQATAATVEERAAARAAIAAARDRVLARAAHISDAERRRDYLEKVPENARTLELARALGA